MRNRDQLLAASMAFAVLLTACAGDSEPSTTTTTETPPATPVTTVATPTAPPSYPSPSTTTLAPTTTLQSVDDGSLLGVPAFDPSSCSFGPPPGEGDYELTFVWNGFLLATTADGAVRCVAPFETQNRILWGPHADRLLAGTTRITEDAAFAGVLAERAVFTRPTGRNLVWVDGGRLWKAAVDGSNIRDISFLPEHVAVAYHPAGVEIATVGLDAAGRYGVWVARNDGTESQRVVTAEEATITEAAFSESSGFFLSFIALHEDGTGHLHELTLIDADGFAVRNEFDATIALETNRTLSGLVANPWTDEMAVTEGSCGDPGGPHARLAWGDDLPTPLAEMATEVLGWLPDSRLVVAAYPDGCDGTREVWTVASGAGTSAQPVLVVRDVGPTAVRSVLPDPPQPLGEIDLDDFA